jgi:glycosyltransferase involved in cell wall biosynthesis
MEGAAVLVPPGDPDALAGALRTLAADPVELARLKRAARQRVEDRFAPAQIVSPLVERLKETM